MQAWPHPLPASECSSNAHLLCPLLRLSCRVLCLRNAVAQLLDSRSRGQPGDGTFHSCQPLGCLNSCQLQRRNLLISGCLLCLAAGAGC